MAIRVLVVDDAAFIRQAMRIFLEKNGIEMVGEAINGIDALEKYKQLSPDVVTMDITMPDCDGLEGLKMILKHDPGAKVIMITAMGQESMVMEAVLAGARNFIVKPFEEDRVVKAIIKLAEG